VFTQLFPILTTPDLDRALRFYRDLLGAAVTYSFPGPDGAPAYVGLELGASHFGVGRDPEGAAGERRAISLWVYAADCDAAVDRLRAAGVVVLAAPAGQPWGERVARVLDPDGNTVIVGAPGA
jgi:lactoylglutathione lyase